MYKIKGSRSKFFLVWDGIIKRVGKNKYYKNISVSESWIEFENFYKDMFSSYCRHVNKHGEKDTTIERIDRLGNYNKENCRWATMKDQGNNRRSNHYLTYNGKTKSLSQWSRWLGITRQALSKRLEMGWSLKKVFTTPKFRGRRFLFDALMKDVINGKFGTKNRAELLLKMEEIKRLFDS